MCKWCSLVLNVFRPCSQPLCVLKHAFFLCLKSKCSDMRRAEKCIAQKCLEHPKQLDDLFETRSIHALAHDSEIAVVRPPLWPWTICLCWTVRVIHASSHDDDHVTQECLDLPQPLVVIVLGVWCTAGLANIWLAMPARGYMCITSSWW